MMLGEPRSPMAMPNKPHLSSRPLTKNNAERAARVPTPDEPHSPAKVLMNRARRTQQYERHLI
eukprot:4469436-Pleurochrysis_carterae.AAC.2